MKKIFFALGCLLSVSVWSYELSTKALENQDLPFISHQGSLDNRFANYLTMEIHYSPIEQLTNSLMRDVGLLKNRGEAHITVITPLEYFDVLKHANITMDEIDQLAQKFNIQAASFVPVCVGKGEAIIQGKAEQTYFIVVNSPDLINLRKKIQDLFVSRKGDANLFKPENYYPHITLGFSVRDLHEEGDKVFKDERTCMKEGKIDLI